MKVFLIEEASFRYNDEWYRREEGSLPVKVYSSEDKAKDELNTLTKSWLLKNNLAEYSEDPEEVFNDVSLIESITGLNFDKYWYENDLCRAFKNLSGDAALLFINNISPRFAPYTVVEFDLVS